MKTIQTSNAPAAIGPYSQAKVVNGFVFASGQIPLNPATGEVEGTTIEAQAEQVMKNVGAILKEAGVGFENVVKTTCFLAEMADFAAFNSVYGKIFYRQAGPFLRCCKAAAEECSGRGGSDCCGRISSE